MHSIIDKKVNLNYRKAVITDGFLFCTKKHVLFGACFFVSRVGSKKGNEKAFLRSLAGSWREVSFAAPTLR